MYDEWEALRSTGSYWTVFDNIQNEILILSTKGFRPSIEINNLPLTGTCGSSTELRTETTSQFKIKALHINTITWGNKKEKVTLTIFNDGIVEWYLLQNSNRNEEPVCVRNCSGQIFRKGNNLQISLGHQTNEERIAALWLHVAPNTEEPPNAEEPP